MAKKSWADSLDDLIDAIERNARNPEGRLNVGHIDAVKADLREMAAEADLWHLVPKETRDYMRDQVENLAARGIETPRR